MKGNNGLESECLKGLSEADQRRVYLCELSRQIL